MSKGRFGPRSDQVAEFFERVDAAEVEAWRSFGARLGDRWMEDRQVQGPIPSLKASASVISAISSAVDRLRRPGGPMKEAEVPMPARGRLSRQVHRASAAIAFPALETPESRQVLIDQFHALGVELTDLLADAAPDASGG